MTHSRLNGVIAAIPTPFDKQGAPDLPRFLHLAQHLLANGCDALNVCGTTGEATSMSVNQRKAVMEAAAGKLPGYKLMVGTGAAAAADAVELSKTAASLGFAGALLLPPFYYKGVSNQGVIAYIAEVVAATADTALPIYLYNFPVLSGVTYTAELVNALIGAFPGRISGIKDSSGDMEYAHTMANLADRCLDVFPSNEGTLLDARDGKFAGCISATATVSSSLCAAAFRDGDAVALESAVAIRGVLSSGALIPNIKSATAMMMGDAEFARVRPPLVALSMTKVRELKERLASVRAA